MKFDDKVNNFIMVFHFIVHVFNMFMNILKFVRLEILEISLPNLRD